MAKSDVSDEEKLRDYLRRNWEEYATRQIDRETYGAHLRTLKKLFPEHFETVFQQNADAKAGLLNKVAFEEQEFNREPWGRAAAENLPSVLHVPFGKENWDWLPYPGGGVYGLFRKSDNAVMVPGKASTGTLRHEGMHSIKPGQKEEYVRFMDFLYSKVLGDEKELKDAADYLGISPDSSPPYVYYDDLKDSAKLEERVRDIYERHGRPRAFGDEHMNIDLEHRLPMRSGLTAEEMLRSLNTRRPRLSEQFKRLFTGSYK